MLKDFHYYTQQEIDDFFAGVKPWLGTLNMVTVDQNGNGDYTTVNAAYAYAKTLLPTINNRIGILILPGDYNEAVVLDTAYLNLFGFDPGSTRIYLSATGYVITKSAANIIVSNLTIENTGTIYNVAHGSWAESVGDKDDSLIFNCVIKGGTGYTMSTMRSRLQTCTVLQSCNNGNARCINDTDKGLIHSCRIFCTFARGIQDLKAQMFATQVSGGNYGVVTVGSNGDIFNSDVYGRTDAVYTLQVNRSIMDSKIKGGVNGYAVHAISGLVVNCRCENSGTKAVIRTDTNTGNIRNSSLYTPTGNYTLDGTGGTRTIKISNVSTNKPFDLTNLAVWYTGHEQDQMIGWKVALDMNPGAPPVQTTIFTAPAGINGVIVDHVIIRNCSGNLTTAQFSFGWNAAGNDVIADSAHTALTGATLYSTLSVMPGAIRGAASGTFKISVNTAQGGAMTLDVEVFGYMY